VAASNHLTQPRDYCRRLRRRRLAHFRFFVRFFETFFAAFSDPWTPDRAFATIFEGLGLLGASGSTTSGGGSFFFGTDYLFFVEGGGPVRVAGLLGFGLAGGAGRTSAGLEGGAGLGSFIGGPPHVAAVAGATVPLGRLAPRTSTGWA